MTADIRKIITEIASDLAERSHYYMEGIVGINSKVHRNTLADSDVNKSSEVSLSYRPDPMIEGLYNQYMEYIESGRKPRHGKQPPVDVIIGWMKKKHIPPRNGNINQVAFLIARAIWRDGYDARPVINAIMDWAENEYDRVWAERLFDAIIKDINNFFD